MSEEWGDLTALRASAESLADAIDLRIATENRVRRGGTFDQFDQEHGIGAQILASAKDHEAACRRMLQSTYEECVPDRVRGWAKGVPGLASGETFPRLIGLLGNPRVATPWTWDTSGPKRVLVPAGDPYERGIRQLWSYCGCGDPQRKPTAGMSQEELLACGKRTIIRPVLFTFSSYLLRAGSPVTKEDSKKFGQPMSQDVADSKYYKLFAQARADGQGKVHQDTCRNKKRPPMKPNGCGTVAHPEWGEPGSPWRPGHALAHAHRVTGKELLKDLWEVSG